MAFDLFITDAAQIDLGEAVEYIAYRLGNPSAASRMLDQVEECYTQLKQFPMLYEQCRDSRLKAMGYRRVVIGNFVLVYQAVEEERAVYILRFFYGGRDYEKLI